MPFAAALDDLLKSTDYFKSAGQKWEDVEPYKSHRRNKATAQEVKQDAPQVTQAARTTSKATSKPQEVKPQEDKPQEVKTAARVASKKTTSKKVATAAGKTSK